MRVAGIDLAASPGSTGVVVLEANGDRWTAHAVDDEADDDLLVAVVRDVVAVGLDAPLGWPDAFVDAVTAHHRGARWPGSTDRRPLTHRRTDHVTREVVGRYPLSVSADLLGVVAMRAALLQQRWADEVWGVAAQRDGSGPLSETYPAAAFAGWSIECRGYKARARPDEARAVRNGLIRELARSTASWLDLDDVEREAVVNDHVLDALVCALVAVAVVTGRTIGPSSDDIGVARREGWIHVPSGPIDELRPPTRPPN